jgi:protein RecA
MINNINALSSALMKAVGGSSEEQEVGGWLDTGYPPLNEALTGDPTRGLPYGRIAEIYGESGTGKTRVALELMLQVQKLGGVVGLSDHEFSWNAEYARKQGLIDEYPNFIYKTPDTWEESNMIACKVVETIRKEKLLPPEAPILWVFDSVAAMIPKSVFDKGIDEYSMNDTTALARVASTTIKAVNQFVARNNAIFVYLNQVRTKPGVVYGDPTTTPGGAAVGFYASVRLELSRKMMKDDEKELVGQIIKFHTKKNRFAKPQQDTELLMTFSDGGGTEFDKVTSLLQVLIAKGKLPYSKPRATWTDGKQYFIKALAEKIKTEGLYPELVQMCA